MGTRFVTLDGLSDRDRGAWRELAANAAEPNPFFEPELVEPAWRALRPAGLRLLVAEGDGGWLACLPVRERLPARRLLAAWTHPYGFLGTPLLHGDATAAAARALLEPLRRRRRTATLLMTHAGAGGAVDAALREAEAAHGLSRAWERSSSRGAAVRHAGKPVPALSSRRSSDLRRLRRRLQEEVGASLAIDDRAGSEQALENFLALERAGWKGERGTALASDTAHRRFFTEMAEGFAAAGRFQLQVLAAGERVVAMSCELRSGDQLFGFKSAYDERLRRHAPGVQLLKHNVDRFYASELTLFDACADGGNALINELLPDRRALTSHLLTGDGAPAALAGGALRGAIALRGRVGAARAAVRTHHLSRGAGSRDGQARPRPAPGPADAR